MSRRRSTRPIRSTRPPGCRPSPTRPAIRRASSPNAIWRGRDAAAVLDRHLQLCQRARHPRFRRRALSRRSGLARAASPSLRRAISCPASTRASSSADDLRDLGADVSETASICVDHCAIPMARDDAYFQRWRAAMDVMAGAPQRHHEDLRARHVRPAVDGRIDPALRAGQHRGFRRRSRRVRHQLAGRPHVQFLSRRRSTPMPRSSPAFRATSRRRCSRAMPNSCSGSEADASDGRSGAPSTGVHHIGMSVAEPGRRACLLGSVSRRAGALANGARPALSRHAWSAIPASRSRRPSSTCPAAVVLELLDYPRCRAQAPNPRPPPIPATSISALRSTDADARLASTRSPAARGRSSPDGPGGDRRRSQQGRQGRLSAHPRRHHARTVPARRQDARGRQHDQAHQLHPPQGRNERESSSSRIGPVRMPTSSGGCPACAACASAGWKAESPTTRLGRRRRDLVRQRARPRWPTFRRASRAVHGSRTARRGAAGTFTRESHSRASSHASGDRGRAAIARSKTH